MEGAEAEAAFGSLLGPVGTLLEDLLAVL